MKHITALDTANHDEITKTFKFNFSAHSLTAFARIIHSANSHLILSQKHAEAEASCSLVSPRKMSAATRFIPLSEKSIRDSWSRAWGNQMGHFMQKGVASNPLQSNLSYILNHGAMQWDYCGVIPLLFPNIFQHVSITKCRTFTNTTKDNIVAVVHVMSLTCSNVVEIQRICRKDFRYLGESDQVGRVSPFLALLGLWIAAIKKKHN